MADKAISSQPKLVQNAKEIQSYDSLKVLNIALSHDARMASVQALNQILADTMTLRDMYKKHHWQVAGPTFYQLHLLFDKHYGEQVEIVDTIAERIQSLGGITIAMAYDVAEMSKIDRPPRGREEPPVQIARLLKAHEWVLEESHKAAKRAAEMGDDGTNDLIVSDVIRPNELQYWFLSEHLVDLPLVNAR
jgi:starvation-inducible DNA-binding protein